MCMLSFIFVFLVILDTGKEEIHFHKALQNNLELMQLILIISGIQFFFSRELLFLFHCHSSSFQVSKIFCKCPVYINYLL